MTTITLPPDLESRLAEEARRRGSTVEEVAVEKLRTMYPSPPELEELPEGATLYDFLKDFIGVLDGPPEISQEIGKSYGDLLYEDYLADQQRRKQNEC